MRIIMDKSELFDKTEKCDIIRKLENLICKEILTNPPLDIHPAGFMTLVNNTCYHR